MGLVVRDAKPEDMDSILGLMQEAFAHHQAGRPDLFSPSLDPAAARSRIEALFLHPDAFNFLAEVDGSVVGQVRGELRNPPKGLVHRERKVAWIDEIVVAKHTRMESIGRKLMQRVADWARERNAQAVSLEVYAFNDSARAFYAALGFETLRLRLEQPLR